MKVTIEKPPTDEPGRWELGLDPWHVDAAPPEVASSKAWKRGVRQAGWFELDHWGNVIGWIPEGAEIQEQEHQ